ncbi:MAG: protoporphyrinogen oxidase [Planctomycetaceae bacterium]|jgi:oxygen-dependent protoporphyrinogen oxidase|nr:protoporphyrinogen oxidase [Planctomycetaceae bacterium]
MKNLKRILILGAGITGLSAAYHCRKLMPDVKIEVWDKQERTGGVLETLNLNGYQIEQSADNFITTVPWGLELCQELGLSDEVVQTNPLYRRTYVVRKGNLHLLPDGFMMMAPTRMWPLAVTPILSPFGKLRAACEFFLPKSRETGDETMAHFAKRRLGREVFERLIEPLVSGVYAADMDKLSVLATLPRFREMEKNHGSLIRAMRAQMKVSRQVREQSQESGARYSLFVTLKNGLSHITDTLASRISIENIRLSREAVQLERKSESGVLYWECTDRRGTAERFDAVIFALPSYETARLLKTSHPKLGELLGKIEHSGTAIATFAFSQHQMKKKVRGMGFVVPKIENSPILAGSFSSLKYVHRAPAGKLLIRIFAGGARAPEMATMPDEELLPILRREMNRNLHIQGEPEYQVVAHWPRTMPQYHLGHLELVQEIESQVASISDVAVAGNSFHGVGIPNCIHSGQQAAESLQKKRGLG